MQEKIEEIKHIQFSLWGIYKDFLADKDPDRYKDRADSFLNNCVEPLKYFCHNLIITWTAIVDWLSEDFKNGCDVDGKINCIKHIQNAIWAMYKAYLIDHNMATYNHKIRGIIKEYEDKQDQQFLTFCRHMFITWMPVMTGFSEEFIREEEKNEIKNCAPGTQGTWPGHR